MFNRNVEAAINDQIKHELYSAYLYLSMSAYAEANNMPGAAKWLGKQAQEEQQHTLKFFGYTHDRGGKVILQAIPQPPSEFTSLLDVFEQVKEHESKVSSLITRLYEIAVKENDYPSQILLQWFITEQVEEEKTVREIVAKFHMVKDDPASILDLDRELGGRGPEAEEAGA